jgi:proteasome alpha subunit
MIDEPYRWVEAVQNRREYIEDQLRSGSPVVLVRYADGLLFATIGRETRKIYEIYDRIGFGALGHPADIEKMRLAAIDLAHLEGFNRAVSDVSLRRLVSFALSPALKQGFEQIFNAPYVVRLILAELGHAPEDDFLCKLDYDGSFSRSANTLQAPSRSYEVLGGSKPAERLMGMHLDSALKDDRLPLVDALRVALETWAMGVMATDHSASEQKERELKGKGIQEDFKKTLSEALKQSTVEAAVLDRTVTGANKFRMVDDKTIRAATKDL